MLNELETILVSWIAQWTQADACAIATTFSAGAGGRIYQYRSAFRA